MSRYLFAYFLSQNLPDGERVRFARTRGTDPLQWEPVAGGEPLLRWDGGRGGVRDPFLLRAAGLPGETAGFYLLGTDLSVHGRDTATFWEAEQSHGSRGFVVWESPDLLSWTEPRLVGIAPVEAGNVWAPESVFDPDRGDYFVFWASRLYSETAARRASYNRMLAARTTDFRSFSRPFVWHDPGHSVIDATVFRDGGWWYRFVKDERGPLSDSPHAPFLTLERSLVLDSASWELIAEGVGAGSVSRPGVVKGEGPIAVPTSPGGPVILFIDEYGGRGYVPFRGESPDTDHWVPIAEHSLPAGARHGSILAISEDEWARLGTLRVTT